jgi:hypothetical protein
VGQAGFAFDFDFSVASWLMLLYVFEGETNAAGFIGTLKLNLVELLEQDAGHTTHFRLLTTVWALLLSQVPSIDTYCTKETVTLAAR